MRSIPVRGLLTLVTKRLPSSAHFSFMLPLIVDNANGHTDPNPFFFLTCAISCENRNVYYLQETEDGDVSVGTIISDGSINVIAFAQTNDVSEGRRPPLSAQNIVGCFFKSPAQSFLVMGGGTRRVFSSREKSTWCVCCSVLLRYESPLVLH